MEHAVIDPNDPPRLWTREQLVTLILEETGVDPRVNRSMEDLIAGRPYRDQ